MVLVERAYHPAPVNLKLLEKLDPATHPPKAAN